jgi:hypothetical protein
MFHKIDYLNLGQSIFKLKFQEAEKFAEKFGRNFRPKLTRKIKIDNVHRLTVRPSSIF